MNFISNWSFKPLTPKALLKTQILMATALSLFIIGNVYAQNILDKSISLKVNNQSIQNIILEIRKQTSVAFLYADIAELEKKATINISNQPLSKVLDLILAPNNMRYELKSDQILILPKQQKDFMIDGKVVDENNEPLLGAIVKTSTTSTQTDINGDFKINISTGQEKLIFSYIGYLTKEITVDNKTKRLYIQLTKDAKALQEVVVTALGIKREERSLGYATSKVEGKQLTDAMSNNWTDALSGKVAGLNLVRSNAGPTSSNSIILRGESNITGSNEALIVLDGVVMNNGSGRTVGTGYRAQADDDSPTDFGSGINDINPDDIESVSVLKGPAAAALYGQRGANGAIIITTKSGSERVKGIGVTFSSNTTFENTMRFPEYQYEYGQGNNNKYYSYGNTADGKGTAGTSSAWGPKFDGQMYFQYDPLTQKGGTERTEWVGYPGTIEQFFETGKTFTNSLSLDGGNKKTLFRFSATNVQNTWILPNTGYTRNSVALSAKHSVNNSLQLSTNVNYTNKFSDNLPSVGYNNQTVMYWAAFMVPNSPISWIKDYWQTGNEGLVQNYPFSSNPDNPYLITNEMLNKSSRNTITGNIKANYNFNEKLSLMLRTAIDYGYEARSQQRPYDTEKFKEGMFRSRNIFSQELTTDFLLNYKTDIGKNWQTAFSFGGSNLSNKYIDDELRADQLLYPQIFNLANSKNSLVAKPYRSQYQINSFYGFANISYKDYLYLDLTGRNDWNSVLATSTSTDNVSFFYPSASLSAIVSEMVNLPSVISFAKLRTSYAGVGSGRNTPYQTSTGYISQTEFSGGLSNPRTFANANLKPLYTSSIEVGADVRFLKNRFGLDVALYQSNTKNQILSAGLDRSVGANYAIVNAGEVQNRGIEIQLNATPIQKKTGFKWNLFTTFSANDNKVLSMTEELPELQLQTGPQGASAVISKVGGSIGGLYGIGFERAPDGQIIYENGYAVNTSQMIYLGDVTPTYKASIGNNFTYKNLNLGFLVDAQMGGVAFSMTHAINITQGKIKETLPGRDEGIIGKGVIKNSDGTYRPNDVMAGDISEYYQAIAARGNAEGNTFSTDFIKFREANLSYNIPLKLSKKIGMQKASIGVFGRNLLILSDWPQFDPEFGTLNDGTIDRGLEAAQFPSTRTFGLKLNIGI